MWVGRYRACSGKAVNVKKCAILRDDFVTNMRILLVCYGNMCRSPMAEGIARKMLASQADVESAGTNAHSGNASSHAIEVMRASFGVDISSHKSRNVRDVPVNDFDYVIAMDSTVADDLRSMYPDINPRLITWEIDDPIGRGVEAYESSAREIQKHVEDFSAHLKDKDRKG